MSSRKGAYGNEIAKIDPTARVTEETTEIKVVRLEILDALSRQLTEVFVGRVHKGETYKFDWTGVGLKDKIYFYRYTSGRKSVYGKMFKKQ